MDSAKINDLERKAQQIRVYILRSISVTVLLCCSGAAKRITFNL